MTSLVGDERDPYALAVLKWLKVGFGGCHFAASFAGAQTNRLFFSRLEAAVMDASMLEEIDRFLEECGTRQQAAVLVFPSVRSTAALVSLVASLHQGRWRLQTADDPQRGTLLSIDWLAKCGRWSSTMGLAPLLSMPVTRRAPHVAIALWPGEPREKSKAPGLSFMDMPSGLPPAAHDEQITNTGRLTESLLGERPKDGPWRRVTFCIEAEHGAALTASHGDEAAVLG